MSLPSTLPPNTLIGGHYLVGTVINKGGFGAVYRGIDTSDGQRPCAIKETYDVTPAARRRALAEFSALSTVRNIHLPEMYDAFEHNGRFYLVMQLIEGSNLLQVLHSRVGSVPVGEQAPFQLSQGPCSEQEVLTWLFPIMEVLQELHSRHSPILHRDIKPGNIILTPQQSTVLVDFGLTKVYDPNTNTQTLTRAVTPGISPLEQYVGKTSPQSDIYSLAATMYLLLTNRLPPPATSRTPNDALIPPRQLNPQLSLQTEQALLKALSLHADDRFQNMQEFMNALRAPKSTFTAFADRTLPAGFPAISPNQPTQPAPQTALPSLPIPPATIPALQAIHPAHTATPHVAAPLNTPRSTQMMAPQRAGSAPMAVKPLPGSFGQGCLWGLLQGILCALLVLALRQVASFYLATFIGYAFYVLAGFLTTRRGGSLWRGAWAGYWGGISSTLMFWIVLWVGILIRTAQYLQQMRAGASGSLAPGEFQYALHLVSPQFPGYMVLPTQPPWINLLILFGGGLLLATGLGGYGGKLGRDRYKEKVARKQGP
jgi:serine/threonine protein kinase